VRDLGRSSLFVYWIHVEMAYGVLSARLHRGLSLEYAYAGFILLSVVLFAIVRIKDRLKTQAVPQFTRRSEQAHVSSSGTW
jgi:fucose 4-O-acetylase-like acetyltransferase